MAVALVLLVSAGLLLRSFERLQASESRVPRGQPARGRPPAVTASAPRSGRAHDLLRSHLGRRSRNPRRAIRRCRSSAPRERGRTHHSLQHPGKASKNAARIHHGRVSSRSPRLSGNAPRAAPCWAISRETRYRALRFRRGDQPRYGASILSGRIRVGKAPATCGATPDKDTPWMEVVGLSAT